MTPLCICAWVAVLILLWITESKLQRIRRFHRQYGWSQRRIADYLGITRWQVRTALAGAVA